MSNGKPISEMTRESFPLLLSAKEVQKIGFSRSMVYQLLNRQDVPVVKIGGRKFINRDKFFIWLDRQSETTIFDE